MRAVVQTVSRASVQVADETVGEIAEGLLVLLGVSADDTNAEAEWMAKKIWQLRILDGDLSCSDVGAPILLVSQFTLYADTAKGRRPSWVRAAKGDVAEPLIEYTAQRLREHGAVVQTGQFGAHMLVESVNVGPRTIILER